MSEEKMFRIDKGKAKATKMSGTLLGEGKMKTIQRGGLK